MHDSFVGTSTAPALSSKPVGFDVADGTDDGIRANRPLVAAGAVLLVHLVLRALTSSSLNGDEADLVLFAQSWRRGYGVQPPLYTWLLMPWIKLFGSDVLSLNAFRTLLLAAVVGLLDLSVLLLTGCKRLAAIMAGALVLIPMFAWNSLTYLTHTMLMTVFALATFCAAIRVIRRGSWGDYLLLGVAVGLGMQSKYNFAVFAIALLSSGLTIAPFRRRILRIRMIGALIVALILTAPHAAWLWENLHDLTARYAEKARTHGDAKPLVPKGAIELIQNMVLLAAPAVAFCAFCFPQLFRRTKAKPAQPQDSDLKLFETWLFRYLTAVAVLHLVFVLMTHAGRLHERWLEPYFVLFPAWLGCRLIRVGYHDWQFSRLCAIVVVLACVLTAVRSGQLWFGAQMRGYNADCYRWDAASSELAALKEGRTVLICDDRGLAGNLLRLNRDWNVVTSERPYAVPDKAREASRYILVWRARSGSLVPNKLAGMARLQFGLELANRPPDGSISGRPLFNRRQAVHFHYAVFDRPGTKTAATRPINEAASTARL